MGYPLGKKRPSLVLVLSLSWSTTAWAQANITANSLAELRSLGTSVNNTTLSLSATGGDPHPVTGVVTPGQYWINGDHFANPTSTHPEFLVLGGSGNTFSFAGATLNLDTRKLDGFGRNLGHDSGISVVRLQGSNNTVQNISVIGQDLALDTDPNAQRYSDWSVIYFEHSGTDNAVDGVNLEVTGSRTDAYGLGDAFGKGASQGITPFLGHRKASAYRVGEASNAVVNGLDIDIRAFGHAFFVQNSTDTTLTNSEITGELFSSQGVIDHPLYQENGVTFHQNEIPEDILISGAEGGVRLYTGSSGLVAENVVVTGTRTGFATSLGGGEITLNNVEAYGVEQGFAVGSNTTITNAKADGVNGPVVVIDRNDRSNSSVEIELVGDQPFNTDYALAYVNGNNIDVSFTSDRPAEDFEDTTLFRTAQFYFDSWRETNGTTTFDVPDYDHRNSVLINDTNAPLVLGEQAQGNVGRSQGGVIGNGRENYYDGVTVVLPGTRLEVAHEKGLGNSGTETGAVFNGSGDVIHTGTVTDATFDDNGTLVASGATLEVLAGIRIEDEKVTITGNGVDGRGAVYSDGSNDFNTRLGSSNNSDESTIVLDGDASIGVGISGNRLLVGSIQGAGNLTKKGAGALVLGKASTFTGDFTVEQGHVTVRPGGVHRDLDVHAGASIAQIGNNGFNTDGDVNLDGSLDLNERTDSNSLAASLGLLSGSGSIITTNPTAGAGGNLELTGANGTADFAGTIAGAISLAKTGDATQTLSGSLTHTGTTTVAGGTLLIDGTHRGGGTYTVSGTGTLGGNGAIFGSVVVGSGGTLAAGSGPGGFHIDDLRLTADAALTLEIGGIASESTYDQITTDTAILGGTLSIALLDLGDGLFVPGSDDSFVTLLASTSLSGSFENVASGQRLATENGEGSFLVTYDDERLQFSSFVATASLQGDYNGDGFTSQGDLDLVLLNIGSTTLPAGFNPAALPGGGFDGLIDQNELDAVLLNFGRGTATNLRAIPEPSALAFIGLGAMGLAARRRI